MRLKNDPSRRVRFELVYWRVHRLRSQNVPSNPIKPYPTGRSLLRREAATQNSPYGTKATRHTVQQKWTQHQTNLFEDEDENEALRENGPFPAFPLVLARCLGITSN